MRPMARTVVAEPKVPQVLPDNVAVASVMALVPIPTPASVKFVGVDEKVPLL